MSEKYLELSKKIFYNNPYNSHECRNYRTPLKIKKNNNDIHVYFYIHINLKDNNNIFDLESRNVDEITGHNLTLYSKHYFENIEKFDINKPDDDNIRILSIFIKHCYDMIDNLSFYLNDARFIDDIDYQIKQLSKITLDDKNKNYYDGEDCSICYEKVNTRTKCNHYLCYFCIQKVNECPICRKKMSYKCLKRSFYEDDEDDDDEEDDD